MLGNAGVQCILRSSATGRHVALAPSSMGWGLAPVLQRHVAAGSLNMGRGLVLQRHVAATSLKLGRGLEPVLRRLSSGSLCASSPSPFLLPILRSLHSSQNLSSLSPRILCSFMGPQYPLLQVPRGKASFSTSASQGAASDALKYDALLIDVGGTLLETAQPVPQVYAEFGRKYGVQLSEAEIKAGFRRAFSMPWPHRLRYEGSGEQFWRFAVAEATGCDSEDMFQELYSHFAKGSAWRIADGATDCLQQLKSTGVKLGIVSNFDTRLRPILKELGVDEIFDCIVVSCEVEHEKPAPEIFHAALRGLALKDPSRVVHLGDDQVNDVEGAAAVGMPALLWKRDVKSFPEVTKLVLG